MDKPEKIFLSVKDVMSLTGLCKASVHNFINRGELEAVKMGRLTKIKKASFETYTQNLGAARPKRICNEARANG